MFHYFTCFISKDVFWVLRYGANYPRTLMIGNKEIARNKLFDRNTTFLTCSRVVKIYFLSLSRSVAVSYRFHKPAHGSAGTRRIVHASLARAFAVEQFAYTK